jgi:hypothetical protein
LDRGQSLVVFEVRLRREVVVVIFQVVRGVETVVQRLAIQVPLAGMIGPIAQRPEPLG